MLIIEVLDRILMLLKENNMKQKDLAKAIGLSSNALTGWKNGNNSSYIKHLPKIAEFLNVSVDYLLGKETEKTEPTVLAYSGNERIDSIAKEILKTDLTEDDLKLIEFILDKYKK